MPRSQFTLTPARVRVRVIVHTTYMYVFQQQPLTIRVLYTSTSYLEIRAVFVYSFFLATKTATRIQAVARIADRTASQHLRGSHDVIGHVTICHFLLVVLWSQASISNGFRDIQRRMSRNG